MEGSRPRGVTASVLFPLKDVRLLESPFSEAVKVNRQYLLAHDPDRLLAPFRREAGLEPKARPYGNWESSGLDGHTAGHYLSALSLMMASGADPDGEFRRRLDYMIDELAQIQKANGDGYLGGIPGSRDYWQQHRRWAMSNSCGESGPLGTTSTRCSPGCGTPTCIGGNEKARDLLVRYGDWCDQAHIRSHRCADAADAQQRIRRHERGAGRHLCDHRRQEVHRAGQTLQPSGRLRAAGESPRPAHRPACQHPDPQDHRLGSGSRPSRRTRQCTLPPRISSGTP